MYLKPSCFRYVYISAKIMSAHVTSNMYHFWHSKICPNILKVAVLPIYIYNNKYIVVLIMGILLDISMTLFIQYIVVVLIMGFYKIILPEN